MSKWWSWVPGLHGVALSQRRREALSSIIGDRLFVVKSLGFAFDSNAVDAVLHWVFRPGIANGVPVKVRATIVVNFRR
jgi:Gram-negative bacterial TonB protein C-terminal